MVIHPIFVHFPIALLSLYAALEIFRINILTRQSYYFPLKAILVILGSIAAFITAQTGEIDEGALRAVNSTAIHKTLALHSTFADVTTWIFAIIAIVYLLAWLSQSNFNFKNNTIIAQLCKYANILYNQYAIIIGLAVLGLIAVTITGALGGSLVHGANADPFMAPVINWLLN